MVIYQQLEEYEKALIDADKVIEITPNIPDGYIRKAIVYHSQGKYEEAKQLMLERKNIK